MTHQLALTVITKIKPGEFENLKLLLGNIPQNRERSSLIPFARMAKLHFARFFITDLTETVKDLSGNPIQASLVFETTIDAPLDQHLKDLANIGAAGLDQIYHHCEGYPAVAERTDQSRVAYLQSHSIASKPFYVNTPGRTMQQIQQEAKLRGTITDFLNKQDWSGKDGQAVRSAIQEFVLSQPDLSWAQLPPQAPELVWRLREALHRIGLPLLGVALLVLPLVLLGVTTGLVLILLVILIGLGLLRLHEEQDIPDRAPARPEFIRQLRDDEDFGTQNQIVAIGFFKPGWFRKITSRLVLGLADYLIRHHYNQGSLSGLNTIHFARWVILDQGRRLFFTSNYDGSLESYMNDFIDKAFWGLNAIFSNGEGFPETRWLFWGGIQDEIAYKTFLPTRQVPTQVWYSAYENLSTVNIQNNALIRQKLFGDLSPSETEAWLRRF